MDDSYTLKDVGCHDSQTALEGISESLRIPGSKAVGPIQSAVRKSKSVLNNDKTKIIADFAPQNKVSLLVPGEIATLRDTTRQIAACSGCWHKESRMLQLVAGISWQVFSGRCFPRERLPCSAWCTLFLLGRLCCVAALQYLCISSH